MTHISPEGLEALITETAERQQKTPDEVRGILTSEVLAKLGYQMVTEPVSVTEQIRTDGIPERENMAIEHGQTREQREQLERSHRRINFIEP